MTNHAGNPVYGYGSLGNNESGFGEVGGNMDYQHSFKKMCIRDRQCACFGSVIFYINHLDFNNLMCCKDTIFAW